MKKYRSALIVVVCLLILMFAMSVTASAASTVDSGSCGANVSWSLDSNGTLKITGSGAMDDYDNRYSPWDGYQYEDIKKVEIGSGITYIGAYAFEHCWNMTSVKLPDSVKSIGNGAFYDCLNITDLKIPSGVTSIGDEAFYRCESLSGVTIPKGVTKIGNGTFSTCASFTSITIPDSITSIGDTAFQYCEGLTNITIPGSVKSIGSFAFETCSNLASITIPNSVTSIGEYAFGNCLSLTSIKIPDSITSLSSHIFFGCEKLTDISLPNTLKQIGSNAFESCRSLQKIKIPDSVEFIGEDTFSKCAALTDITIPYGVKSIEYGTFDSCFALTSVTIPESVTAIGQAAFIHCTGFTSFTVPDSVTSIGNSAFFDCARLKSITIPDSVTSFGSDVLGSCTSLKTVYFGGSKEKWDEFMIYSTPLSKNVKIYYDGTTEETAEIVARGTCGANLSWTLDADGLLRISGTGDMDNCTDQNSPWNEIKDQIVDVVIKNGVTSIGDYAFYQCKNLLYVSIPSSVTVIGNRAFYEADRMNDIVIPDGVETIGDETFYYCNALRTVTIPASVTKTGDDPFIHCAFLTDIYFGGTAAQWEALRGTWTNGLRQTVHIEKQLNKPVISSISNTVSAVQIKWSAVPDASNYRVFKKVNGKWAELADTKGTSYIDESVISGNPYTYTVRCVTADGETYTSSFDTNGKTIIFISAPTATLSSTSTGVKVTWNAVNGAEKYRVFKKVSGKWTALTDTTATSYVDTAVATGNSYTYTVRCISADGKTYTSNFDSTGKTAKYMAVPAFTVANAANGVKVTWNDVNGAENYRVFKKISGKWTALGDTSSTSYLDTTAATNTSYTYTVRCISADGKTYTSNFNSSGKTIKFMATPTFTVANAANGVKVTWDAVNGAENYRVFKKISGKWTALGDTSLTTYLDTTAVTGTSYTYTVRCISSDGKTYTSNFNTSGKTIKFMVTPTFEIENSDDGVLVTWDKVNGAAKYRVFKKVSGKWTALTDTTGTSFIDTTAIGGESYTYTVRCISADGKTYTSNFNSSGKTIVSSKIKPETEGELVWIPTNGGTKYHSNQFCSSMIDPIQVSVETAVANGCDACKRCYG